IVYQQAMQLGVSKRDPIHTFRFNAIDRWIAPLQFLAEEVKSKTRFSPNKIHVIPLAIDIVAFENGVGDRNACRKKFGLDQESIWIGIAGRIDRLKGQHLAIEALARLASDFPNVKVVIAGEPTRGEPTDYADSLRNMVDTLQLDSKVLFLPFTQEVSSFYTAIDICAMTSVGETFGMVTIEAMMCGCAVVGTNSSGTPELLHHGELGLLFEPGSSEGLESALRKLIENPDLRHRLGSKAKSFAQQQFSHLLVCRRIAQDVLGPMGLKSTE
ncbi:MAG: glycosyltransferase family 4 protein, partial [Flavobacteriales bacterium]|nr:glycosyltransferase family 4 protein [Flavobacteriales bacterium]